MRYWQEEADFEAVVAEVRIMTPDQDEPIYVSGPIVGCGVVKGSREQAVERMVAVDLAAIQAEADGNPYFIFDDGLEGRLRVRNGLRLAAALGEQEA